MYHRVHREDKTPPLFNVKRRKKLRLFCLKSIFGIFCQNNQFISRLINLNDALFHFKKL